MPFDPQQYETTKPSTKNSFVTQYSDLTDENQKFFDQLAAGVGMKSGQEYLDWRKGFDQVSTYYGDVPLWQRTASGKSTMADKIAMMEQAFITGAADLPPNLAKAVASGLITASAAASYYWNNNLRDINFKEFAGLQNGVSVSGLSNVTNSSNFNGTGSGSSGNGLMGANGSFGTATTGAFSNLTQEKQAERVSAWSVLKEQFGRYGMGDLVDSLKQIILDGASGAEMLLRLREAPSYKTRFAANDARIANGMRALSEAEYIGLEDAYAGLMRKYGLPDWYTQQGQYGKQTNLEKFIANDVSPAELEDRIQLGVNRVQNGPKEVLNTLRNFYPGISNGDILAYVLDPKKALPVLQRQITTAEIGGEATRYGLQTDLARSDELAELGVNQSQARQGYQVIGSGLQRGTQLANLYNEDYNQAAAEQEVFGMNNAQDAAKKRRRITGLEQATFGGSSGIAGGALNANRAGNF